MLWGGPLLNVGNECCVLWILFAMISSHDVEVDVVRMVREHKLTSG